MARIPEMSAHFPTKPSSWRSALFSSFSALPTTAIGKPGRVEQGATEGEGTVGDLTWPPIPHVGHCQPAPILSADVDRAMRQEPKNPRSLHPTTEDRRQFFRVDVLCNRESSRCAQHVISTEYRCSHRLQSGFNCHSVQRVRFDV